MTKRRGASPVWHDRAERFTPPLSGGNICVLANGRRSLGRRGNRLPAAVRGDGPCRGSSESVMEMKGKSGGGGNPCIQSRRGDTKEKSGSEGFTETPSCLSFSIRDALDYTLAVSRPRMPLSRSYGTTRKIESFTF